MKIYPVLLVLFTLLLFGCQPEDTSPIGRYRTAVNEGLQADAAPKETVLGLQLGDTDRQFFDHCTQLNQQQLITNGNGGNVVVHAMPDDLDRPAQMTFRPVFIGADPRRVQAIELRVIYDDWSPWNASASADSLLPKVADYFRRTLSTDPIEIQHPQHGRTFTSVDGNRLLALWKEDGSTVKGMITDLSTLDADPLQLAK